MFLRNDKKYLNLKKYLTLLFVLGTFVFGANCGGFQEDTLKKELLVLKAKHTIEASDNGNSPEVPGCVKSYRTQVCKVFTKTVYGEFCLQKNTILFEHTVTNKCTTNGVIPFIKINCDTYCKKRGRGAGACVPMPKFCGQVVKGSTTNSAKCVCDKPPANPTITIGEDNEEALKEGASEEGVKVIQIPNQYIQKTVQE